MEKSWTKKGCELIAKHKKWYLVAQHCFTYEYNNSQERVHSRLANSIMQRSRQVKHVSNMENRFPGCSSGALKGKNGCEAFLLLDHKFYLSFSVPYY